MRADPEAGAREMTRVIAVKDLAGRLREVTGELERGTGTARQVLANAYVDDPELAELKGRLLAVLHDAGAVLGLAQADQGS